MAVEDREERVALEPCMLETPQRRPPKESFRLTFVVSGAAR
jgi:hypothetical protein